MQESPRKNWTSSFSYKSRAMIFRQFSWRIIISSRLFHSIPSKGISTTKWKITIFSILVSLMSTIIAGTICKQISREKTNLKAKTTDSENEFTLIGPKSFIEWNRKLKKVNITNVLPVILNLALYGIALFVVTFIGFSAFWSVVCSVFVLCVACRVLCVTCCVYVHLRNLAIGTCSSIFSSYYK